MIAGIIGFVIGTLLTVIIANIKNDTVPIEVYEEELEHSNDLTDQVIRLAERLEKADKDVKGLEVKLGVETSTKILLTEALEDVKLERDFYKVVLEDYLG